MANLRHHRLLPALGAALLCQAGLLGLLRPSTSRAGRTLPAGDESRPVDDTPELMRLSRSMLLNRSTVNPALAQLLSLPLPPPPELTKPPQPQPTSAKAPCPAKPTPPTPTPSTPPAAKARTAQAPAAGELPSQPGLALDLARAIAGGNQSLPAEGASPAQVALQRRQWWLTDQESSHLQQAWDQAATAAPPDAWNTLPAGAQLRRVDRESLGALAAGDPRGRSLVSRDQITLLWASGPDLWLLRLPLAG